MNVLVYNGPGVSQTSLSFTLSCLRTLLLPNYTVQTVSPQSLSTDPWQSNCSLLVIPGGRDIPYLAALQNANAKIATYVRGGGAFLGICAGAYYACRRIEWEMDTPMEVCGERPLRFFGGVSRGCVFPGFQYESEAGARLVSLSAEDSSGTVTAVEGVYYNGGGEFLDVHLVPGAKILAKYTEGEANGKVAAVSCQVGDGTAVLWSTHPEYSLTQEPASLALSKSKPELAAQAERLENRRWSLMRDTLRRLKLELPRSGIAQSINVLPQFLTTSTSSANVVGELLQSLSTDSPGANHLILKDHADTFHFTEKSDHSDFVGFLGSIRTSEAATDDVKRIVLFPDAALPPAEATPLFDLRKYYSSLVSARNEVAAVGQSPSEWAAKMGDVALYGEIVTSTQSLLDKNPKLLSLLPSPLLSVASNQIAGRGRGSNTWLSPPGCLQFSLLVRLSLSTIPASRIVFIQYLFALAVVEACRAPTVLGKLGEKVRLKWPNDIYVVSNNTAGMKKVGGILVNTSFTGGIVEIVIGCGLNVSTPPPITSLAQVVPPGVQDVELSVEDTLAAIMARFDAMWAQFTAAKGSFDPFIDLYLERWLHSDQLVTLTTVDPPVQARIVGITLDHGLLRTMPETQGAWSHRGDNYIDLQPDGNSFDLMAGLIRAKR